MSRAGYEKSGQGDDLVAQAQDFAHLLRGIGGLVGRGADQLFQGRDRSFDMVVAFLAHVFHFLDRGFHGIVTGNTAEALDQFGQPRFGEMGQSGHVLSFLCLLDVGFAFQF